MLALLLLAAANGAAAQDIDAGVPDAGPDASVSAAEVAEVAEIEAALAQDRVHTEAAPTAAQRDPEPAARGGAAGPLNPDISVISDVALAVFSDPDRQLQTGGHDPTANGFNLQQLELSIGAAVDPYFRFDANLVFSLVAVEVEEAYGTTLDLPGGLQIRAGQFLTRFGRINPTHPHTWDFVDQPFAIGRVFGSEGNRGLGAEISWLTPLPWFVELVASATGAGGEQSARSFYGDRDLGVESPLDLQYTTAVKQFFDLSDDLSLLWGLSAAFGPNGTGRANRSEVYGTDVYLKYRPISRASDTIVSLQTEWLYRRRQVPGDVLADLTGYAQLFWRFARRWGTAARYELGTPALGLDGEVAADPLDPEWTAARHRVAAALTFWPTEFSRLRAQVALDDPSWEEPIWAAFLSLELITGAHGAHQF